MGILFFKKDAVRRAISWHSTITYDKQLHNAIKGANKVVIRNGGFDCCGRIDDDPIYFTIENPIEINRLNSNLVFKKHTTSNSHLESCMCCGSPGIDWYKDKTLLAMTAVQHGQGIRWKGFSTRRVLGVRVSYGDAPLTEESSRWLTEWLTEKEVYKPKKKETANNDDTSNSDSAAAKSE